MSRNCGRTPRNPRRPHLSRSPPRTRARARAAAAHWTERLCHSASYTSALLTNRELSELPHLETVNAALAYQETLTQAGPGNTFYQ